MNSPGSPHDDVEVHDDVPPEGLSGERLEAWYRKYESLTPEQRQRIQENKDSRLATNVFLVILVLVSLGNFFIPLFGLFLASILGIWLVIGRGSVFERYASAGVALILWNIPMERHVHGDSAFLDNTRLACLTMCTLLAAGLTYGAALVLARVYRAPSRLAQFSILELAGTILAIGLAAAMMRSGVAEFLGRSTWNRFDLFNLVSSVVISVNTVLISLPMLVPKRFRNDTLSYGSLGIVLVATPIGEGNIFSAWLSLPLLPVLLVTVIAHVVAGLVIWLIMFLLEEAGAFREPSSTALASTIANDQLDEMA
ncbi:hypothetical protein [Blastopirellula marina]|uniref:Uncharacterized protein n=1 Tax=Blastopirellula marina TaxID=124 RepID=A0A2S8GP89_9BACT|nr:hypothetical protein [Blastopirellula marina]PQO46171.1 hypothetical protein C5Y93_09275 [Blastopirellula marina]